MKYRNVKPIGCREWCCILELHWSFIVFPQPDRFQHLQTTHIERISSTMWESKLLPTNWHSPSEKESNTRFWLRLDLQTPWEARGTKPFDEGGPSLQPAALVAPKWVSRCSGHGGRWACAEAQGEIRVVVLHRFDSTTFFLGWFWVRFLVDCEPNGSCLGSCVQVGERDRVSHQHRNNWNLANLRLRKIGVICYKYCWIYKTLKVQRGTTIS